MKLLNTVLLATDFNESSEDVIRMATLAAQTFHSEIIALHVVPKIRGTPNVLDVLRDQAAERMNELKKEVEDRGITVVEAAIVSGVPFHEICRQADVHQANVIILGAGAAMPADLLVMGTVGRTGLARMLMGSVTEKVVREMRCSVLAMKSEDVIRLRLEAEAADMETYFQQGRALMEREFPEQAIEQFELCLSKSPTFAPIRGK